MNIQPHFEELFELLEENEVEYMVVGGYAVAFHGYPRFTKDIDLFYRRSEQNVERLRQALIGFDFREEDLPRDDFLRSDRVLTFGVPPNRVDLMNDIDGVSFEEAIGRAVRGRYGRVEVSFIGRRDLLENKAATPRARDKADIEALEGE